MQMPGNNNVGVEALAPILCLFGAALDAKAGDARHSDQVLTQRPVIDQNQGQAVSHSIGELLFGTSDQRITPNFLCRVWIWKQ